MVKVYILIIACLSIYIFCHSSWFRTLQQKLHDLGLLSRKDKLTMFDVRQMLIKGIMTL